MKIAILKYKAGNIYSVINSLKRLGVEPVVTDDVNEVICNLRQPVLGICIGMQLMCRHSEEGDTNCLDIFHVDVKRFIAQSNQDKIPAVGWNEISNLKSPLFKDIVRKEFVYFIHSYYAPLSAYTIADTDYILPYSAALNYKNFYAVQFHPEKSGDVGEKILNNFLSL